MAVLRATVGIPLLTALSSIFDGYALSVLWGWFIVPTFHLPPLSIPSAIGIALVIGFLTKQVNDCKEKERSGSEKFVYYSVLAFLKPAIALFLGWIVKMFM